MQLGVLMAMLLDLAVALAPSIPLMGVQVALLVLAVKRRNRHARVSMFAATSAVVMLLADLITHAGFAIFPLRLFVETQSPTQLSGILGVVRAVSAILNAVALAILVAAVFCDRAVGPAASRS